MSEHVEITEERILDARTQAAAPTICARYEDCGKLPRCAWCHRAPETSLDWFDWALSLLGIPMKDIARRHALCEECDGKRIVYTMERCSTCNPQPNRPPRQTPRPTTDPRMIG